MNKQNIELGVKLASLGVAFGIFGVNVRQHQAFQQARLDDRFNQLDKKIDDKFNILDKKIDDKFNILDKKIDDKFDLLRQDLTAFLIAQTKN